MRCRPVSYTHLPDHDGHKAILLPDGGVDLLARPAVFGRIVQQIGEHLPQPLRISGQRGKLPLGVCIIEGDALLLEKLPIRCV